MKSLLSIVFLLIGSTVLSPILGTDVVTTFGGLAVVSALPIVATSSLFTIPIVDARSLYTSKLIAIYKEMPVVTGFLRSFFTPVESMTKEVSIMVSRGKEKIAVDVYRHHNGNHNAWDKVTEKLFLPPLYDEYFTANEHRLYDQVMASLMAGEMGLFEQMTMEQAQKVVAMQEKIDRSTELQCAQIMQTGIVELISGENIDFKRKAASLVDPGAGNYWATGATDARAQIEAGCNFLRQVGKANGATFNLILGSTALADLLNNDTFKEQADIRRFNLDDVRQPQRDANGAGMHGEITCGSYLVRLWTYPQFYDDANDVSTPYMDPKNVVLLPEHEVGTLAYAAVPQLMSDGGTIVQQGRYLVRDFVDHRQKSHEVHVESAPLAVPVKIDQIYTLKAVS